MSNVSSRAQDRELSTWFNRIANSEIKLPRFQRHQAWDKGRIVSLLEVIMDNLPLGVALILEVGDEEQFKSRHLATAPTTDRRVLEHLLDGQQRLTALWRSLHNNYESSTYFLYIKDFDKTDDNIDYDHDCIHQQWRSTSGTKRYPLWTDKPTVCFQKGLLPLQLLRPFDIQTEINEWIEEALSELKPTKDDDDFAERYEHYFQVREKLLAIIQEKREKIKHYNLPYLSLPAKTPKDVALKVFINMNTNTKPLSTYDIIVAEVEEAAGLSLHELQEKLHSEQPFLSQLTSLDNLILSTSALLQDKQPYNKGFLQMDKVAMMDNWDDMSECLGLMTRFVKSQGVVNNKLLPTNIILSVIAALYNCIPVKLDKRGNAEILLKKYFWGACLTDRYDNNTIDRATRDFKTLKSVFLKLAVTDDVAELEKEVPAFNRRNFPVASIEQLIGLGWPKKQNIKSRALLCITAKLGAFDFADGDKLDEHSISKRDYHHLFPKDMLKNIPNDSDKALNCTLISSSTNRSIGAKNPYAYIQDRYSVSDNETINNRLNSHLIPIDPLKEIELNTTDQDLIIQKYERFLNERAKLFKAAALRLCDGKEVTIENIYSHASDILPELKSLNKDISYVETQIRVLIDQEIQSIDFKSLDQIIPYKSIESAKNKFSKWLKNNPGVRSNQEMSVKDVLDNMSLSEYCDIIIKKSNWPIYETRFGSKGNVMKRFQQLATCRNRIRHDNYVTDIERKEGEAAILWFKNAFEVNV